jgi:phosphoesterase RecJ-like protein
LEAQVPENLIRFIRSGKKFIIAGHKEPDGDCVGSQLALCSALGRLGKKVIACSAGPFKRTEINPFASSFVSRLSAEEQEEAAVILLDCSTAERTGDLAPFLKGLPLAVVDHHAQAAGDGVVQPASSSSPAGGRHVTGDRPLFGDQAPLLYLDITAPSVTFMILRIIQALGMEPNREEAELLLFGLCTDTGFFRHVDDTGAAVFEAAADMIRAGANPKQVFAWIHGGKSLNSRILMGLVLARSQAHFGGKLVLSWETFEESQKYGLEGRDSDSLYQMFQSVDGAEAICIIRQETPENCTVGLRSRDKVDVSAIAAEFGGGGHKNASGFSYSGKIEELRPKLLEAFKKVFQGEAFPKLQFFGKQP